MHVHAQDSQEPVSSQEVGDRDGEPGDGAEKEQGEGSEAIPSSPEEWPESPTGEGQNLSPGKCSCRVEEGCWGWGEESTFLTAADASFNFSSDTIGPESPTAR